MSKAQGKFQLIVETEANYGRLAVIEWSMFVCITNSLFSKRLSHLSAILSLAVVLFGTPVHLHLESDCESSACSTEAENPSSHCRSGCKHYTPSDRDHDHGPHDSGHCAVCSLLAQTPDVVEIVEVEATADLTVTDSIVSDRVAEVLVKQQLSRGPPTT